MANIKYNKELGGNPLIVEFEDGSEKEYYPNTLVMIKRNGIVSEIKACELVETDDIIK
jgi:hypothetical protein